MAIAYTCPYYKYERKDQLKLSCEIGRLHFRSNDHRRWYVYRFCASPDGWKKCTICQGLNYDYEREEKEKWRD